MRASRYEEEELAVAKQHFPVYRYRAEVPRGSLVVGRYANLPFHGELEQDLRLLGSSLVNSTMQHQYVANFDYYADLQDVTFPTWFRLEDVPAHKRNSAFVVKGRTNSRKQAWATHMHASDFAAAARLSAELLTDALLGPQGLVVREYVPLEVFEVSCVNGLPFANEWRLFYYRGRRLAHGYYWSAIDDWSLVRAAEPGFEREGLPFADEVALRLVDKIPFVVIDIARTVEGRWVVVELNDGCQSGLNDSVPAEVLYRNLRAALSC